jgi:hypothetical protein
MSIMDSVNQHLNEVMKKRMVSEMDTFFVLLGPNEFHYCEPGNQEFTCKFGKASARRDSLPEGFSLSNRWIVASVENEEEMLSAYDDFMSNREQ